MDEGNSFSCATTATNAIVAKKRKNRRRTGKGRRGQGRRARKEKDASSLTCEKDTPKLKSMTRDNAPDKENGMGIRYELWNQFILENKVRVGEIAGNVLKRFLSTNVSNCRRAIHIYDENKCKFLIKDKGAYLCSILKKIAKTQSLKTAQVNHNVEMKLRQIEKSGQISDSSVIYENDFFTIPEELQMHALTRYQYFYQKSSAKGETPTKSKQRAFLRSKCKAYQRAYMDQEGYVAALCYLHPSVKHVLNLSLINQHLILQDIAPMCIWKLC